MKARLYEIKAEYLYSDDREVKREKQLDMLNRLGLKESKPGFVFANAEQALDLILSGYTGRYFDTSHVEEVYTMYAGPDVSELFSILTDKIGSLAQLSLNERVGCQQPGFALQNVTETMLLEDSCTDNLQSKIAEGWRILAIQPQPDQRRPDYILGRVAQTLPQSAARG